MRKTGSSNAKALRTHPGARAAVAWGALLAVACGRTDAAVYCVTTGAQLHAALTAAGSGGVANGSDNTILVASGTFQTSGVPFNFGTLSGHALTLEGGYDAGCSHQDPAPNLSILDGGGLTRILTIETNGAITVRHLTFQNAFYSGSAGAAGQFQIDAGGSATFADNVVRSNVSGFSVAGFTFGGLGTLRIDNNLFIGNTAPTAAAFSTVMSDNTTTYITNNTIADNTDTTDNNWVATIGGGSVTAIAYISNTVSYGNHGTGIHDFYLSGFETATFTNDAYTSIVGSASPASAGNLVGIDAQFVAADDFHLRSTSPLLRAGTPTPAGGLAATDIEGHPRSVGGRVDIGAYQSVDFIFADEFELP